MRNVTEQRHHGETVNTATVSIGIGSTDTFSDVPSEAGRTTSLQPN